MINKQVNENWEAVYQYINNAEIKHYSFDFWNTIAYSNSEFKKKRAELVAGLIKNNFSISDVSEAFAKVGTTYNKQQESGLGILSPFNLLDKVLNELTPSISYYDLNSLKFEIDSLFLKYPPHLDNNLNSIIERIQFHGKTCSITSNTAFISGDVIWQFLSDAKLLDNFSFTLFSNDVGFGKPSSKMYEHLYLKAKVIHPQLKKSEVLHIGDNEVADYKGALEFGLKSFQFNVKPNFIHKRYAVHTIVDTKFISFNAIEYSKFKFGDTLIAEKYGNQLFEYFRNSLLPEIIAKHSNFLIYSSPYAKIPTSSYYLTQSFYTAFSDYLKDNKIKNVNVRFCKIKRCQTYTEDYGALSAEARFNLIKNDTYAFVNIPSADDVCVFIDDISITGNHQRVVEKLMDDSFIETKSIFLYYAKLSNPEICPSFENYLNYSFNSDVIKLMDVILSDSYKITTRTTKYILSLQPKDLAYLISEIKKRDKNSILNELVDMSYANEYNNIELYNQNLKILKQCILELDTEAINLK
jgi:FMN phosphatase YigB (HAD superfamily)